MRKKDFAGIKKLAGLREPGILALAAIYLVFAAVVVRTLTSPHIAPLITEYIRLELIFGILFTLAWFLPRFQWLMCLYLVVQSILVLMLVVLHPIFDFVVLLFLILCYQSSFFFSGRLRWTWVMIFVLLTGGSLTYFLGLLHSLAVSLTTIAGEIVVTAYLTVNEETETAKAKSQLLLKEISASHRELKLHTSQVEELTGLQERGRISRVLHDSVSQLLFSISYTTRAAELAAKQSPERLPTEITHLTAMTSETLRQLKSLITELRLTEDTSHTDSK